MSNEFLNKKLKKKKNGYHGLYWTNVYYYWSMDYYTKTTKLYWFSKYFRPLEYAILSDEKLKLPEEWKALLPGTFHASHRHPLIDDCETCPPARGASNSVWKLNLRNKGWLNKGLLDKVYSTKNLLDKETTKYITQHILLSIYYWANITEKNCYQNKLGADLD
jgi:hypothetical protein